MATKTINGSYTSGYTLAPTYNGVNVTQTGSIAGAFGADGANAYDPKGGYGGTGGPGGAGLSLPNGGSVTNNGTIVGGHGGYGGNVWEYFYTFSAFSGWYIGQSGDGGPGGDGIHASAFASITNFGTIAGGAGGSAGWIVGSGYRTGYPGANGIGVNLTAGGNVTNYGDINGSLGIYLGGAGTVVNHATIEGGVKFGAPGGTLIAYGGSSLLGGATGDGGALELKGGASVGVIEGISGFGSVTFANGADWDFRGTNSIPTGLSIAAGGELTIDGSLTTYGSLAGTTNVNGTLEVEAGKTLSLQGGTLSNFSGSTLAAGVTLAVGTGATLQLPSNDFITTLQGTIIFEGAGSVVQSLKAATSKEVSVEDSLRTIDAGGALGLTLEDWSSPYTINNAGTISLSSANFSAAGLNNTGTLSGMWAVYTEQSLTIDAPTKSTGTINGDGSFIFEGAANSFAGLVVVGGSILLTTGITTLGKLTLQTGYNFFNNATVQQSGGVTLRYHTTIDNTAGATWNIANSIFVSYYNDNFTNEGLLTKTGGPSLVRMDPNFQNTGTLTIASGTIDFDGGSNSFGGTVNGQGTLVLGGTGLNSLVAGLALTVAHVTVQDTTTVGVNTNLAYNGAWTQKSGAVSVAAGDALALQGPTEILSGEVNGAGSFKTLGTTTVKQATLGGTAQWLNSGALTQTGGTFTIGDGGAAIFNNQATGVFDVTGKVVVAAGAQLMNAGQIDNSGTLTLNGQLINSGKITNEAGGKLIFAADVAITTDPSVKAGQFSSAGLIEKTGGTGTSIVRTGNASLTETGTIYVKTGTIELTGNAANVSGMIEGPGTIEFGPGDTTLSASITTGGFAIAGTGAHVTSSTSLSYSRAFAMKTNAELTLASPGKTWTLGGSASFSQATIDGFGQIVTDGTTSLTSATLDGSAQWENDGKLTETGLLTVAAGHSTAFTNDMGAVFDLAGNVGIDGTGTGNFLNQGLLAKTAGTGIGAVAIALMNTGTVEVGSGTIDLTKAVGGTGGTLQIDSGKILQADAGVGTGQTVLFKGTGDKLTLTDATDFHAKLSGFAATDKIDLTQFGTGTTLAYSGNATQGILTITDGALQAKLSLLGQYAAAGFHVGTDGHSGSLITYTPPPSPNLIADHLAASTV